jgi:hypothetical protein
MTCTHLEPSKCRQILSHLFRWVKLLWFSFVLSMITKVTVFCHPFITPSNIQSNSLDLGYTLLWGREIRDVCACSGDCLPSPSGCDQDEGVLLGRMKLTRAEAVVHVGGHTLVRGDRRV